MGVILNQFCFVLGDFQIYRIQKYIKWLIYVIKFGGNILFRKRNSVKIERDEKCFCLVWGMNYKYYMKLSQYVLICFNTLWSEVILNRVKGF